MSKKLATVQASRERYADCLQFLRTTGVSLEGKTISDSDLHLVVPITNKQTSYDVQIIQNQIAASLSLDPRQRTLAAQDLFYATEIGIMYEVYQPNTTSTQGTHLGYGTYLTAPNELFLGGPDPTFNDAVGNLWSIDMLWNNLSINTTVSNKQIIRGLSGQRFRYVPQTYYNFIAGDQTAISGNLLTMQEESDGFIPIVPGLVVDGSISTVINLTYSAMPPAVGAGNPTDATYKQWNAHVFLRGFLCMNCAGNNAGADAARVLMALEAAKGGLPIQPVTTPMGSVIPGYNQ